MYEPKTIYTNQIILISMKKRHSLSLGFLYKLINHSQMRIIKRFINNEILSKMEK